jgi:hypothetical protein
LPTAAKGVILGRSLSFLAGWFFYPALVLEERVLGRFLFEARSSKLFGSML